jgi:hypothetical protein
MTKKHKKSWPNKLTVLGLFLTLLLAPCFACLAEDYLATCETLSSGQGYAVMMHGESRGELLRELNRGRNVSKLFLQYNPQFAGCTYYHGPDYVGPTKDLYKSLLKSTRTHGAIYDLSCAGETPWGFIKCRGSTIGARIMQRPVIQAAPGYFSGVGLLPSVPGFPAAEGPYFCITTERFLPFSHDGKMVSDNFAPTRVQVAYPDGRIKVVPEAKAAYLFGPDTVLRDTDGAFIRGKNRAYDPQAMAEVARKRLAHDHSICSIPQIRSQMRKPGGVKRTIGGAAVALAGVATAGNIMEQMDNGATASDVVTEHLFPSVALLKSRAKAKEAVDEYDYRMRHIFGGSFGQLVGTVIYYNLAEAWNGIEGTCHGIGYFAYKTNTTDVQAGLPVW